MLGVGGPVWELGGGWDWWVLVCIPATFVIARRIVRSPPGIATIVISVCVGTILSDVLRARGVATAVTLAFALTALGVAVRRSVSPQPPPV
ncbi:MAG TPA: hypothetical protein VIB62_04760 [Actinomycetota bacterium]|jgi:hypothetical protein